MNGPNRLAMPRPCYARPGNIRVWPSRPVGPRSQPKHGTGYQAGPAQLV